MNLLRRLFACSEDKPWQQFASAMGAKFVPGGIWAGNKVVAIIQPWTLTLDYYTVTSGQPPVATTYTRLRAPFVSRDGLRFSIHRRNMFHRLWSLFGWQGLQSGFAPLDRDFVCKTNDPARLLSLLDNARIRAIIQAQPHIYLRIKDDDGWFRGQFPPEVDELDLRCIGLIRNFDRLKSLFELLEIILRELGRMGSASEEDPRVAL